MRNSYFIALVIVVSMLLVTIMGCSKTAPMGKAYNKFPEQVEQATTIDVEGECIKQDCPIGWRENASVPCHFEDGYNPHCTGYTECIRHIFENRSVRLGFPCLPFPMPLPNGTLTCMLPGCPTGWTMVAKNCSVTTYNGSTICTGVVVCEGNYSVVARTEVMRLPCLLKLRSDNVRVVSTEGLEVR